MHREYLALWKMLWPLGGHLATFHSLVRQVTKILYTPQRASSLVESFNSKLRTVQIYQETREPRVYSARGKIAFFLWQTSGIICGNHLDEKPTIYPLARELYDSHRLDSGRNRKHATTNVITILIRRRSEKWKPFGSKARGYPINKSPV